MIRRALLLLPALLLGAFALAQEEPPPVRTVIKPDVQPPQGDGPEGRPTGEEGMKGEMAEKMDLPRHRHARGFCNFVTSVQPARVPPGGQGKLIVTMLLEGDTVLTSPPPMRFSTPAEQGPFLLGEPAFRPAKPGYLSRAFRGQPVYDNYAIFEVPFAVKRDARFGKHRLFVQMEFELHNGNTGQPIETFLDRAGAMVEIGVPPPEAAPVVMAPVADDGQVQPPPAQPTPSGEPASASPGPETGPAGSGDPQPIGARLQPGQSPEQASGPEPTTPGDGTEDLAPPQASPLPWMLGGLGAVLLLLALVLLRRR